MLPPLTGVSSGAASVGTSGTFAESRVVSGHVVAPGGVINMSSVLTSTGREAPGPGNSLVPPTARAAVHSPNTDKLTHVS